MFKHLAKNKHGDTLVEVTLAIGIFSMVAVAAVSVLSASTSSAEDTLEASITREQIDAQADALRFIQNAALVDHDTATPKFSNLWDEIKKNAIVIDNTMTDSRAEELLQYVPDSCSENYSSTIEHNGVTITNDAYNKAFIIDPNQLSNYANASMNEANAMLGSVYINKNAKNNATSPILTPASTFPRLIYNTSSDKFLSSDVEGNLSLAEGIYVVAVKDSRDSTADYYDFYIRTCWYNTDDSERPSTISTVIRLNDLDATKYEIDEGTVSYNTENSTLGSVEGNYPTGTTQLYGRQVTVAATPNPNLPKLQFIGWYDSDNRLVSTNNPYTYTINRKNITLTAKFGFKIKVLNVYPPQDPAATISGASSASLKTWMEQWGVNEESDGVKELKVTPVPIASFNANPYSYLGSKNNWNYDIIVFGFWDYNGKADLTASSAAATRDFINNNGGVLFGHDTLDASSCDASGTYFHPHFYSLIDLMDLECIEGGNSITDKVKIVKTGIFTDYPYKIGNLGSILTIPPAHRTRFRSHGTVWLRFDNLYEKPDSDNFYLASSRSGRTAFINTGHSNGQATPEERKIIANVLFYLYK